MLVVVIGVVEVDVVTLVVVDGVVEVVVEATVVEVELAETPG